LPAFDELSADDLAQMRAVTGAADLDELRDAMTSAASRVEERWHEVAPRYVD
jgi:hypothetical protein